MRITTQRRVALAGLLLLLQMGCDSTHNHAEIRFGLASAPANLDPRFATDAAASRLVRLLYRPLVGFDDAFKPVPACAEWLRQSPLRYRFTLRTECGQFHHGRAVLASDVKATYESILDPAQASPFRSRLSLIKAIKVLDDKQVEFELSHADPWFPAYLDIGIMPADLLQTHHPFSSQPVGSGAFRFLQREENNRLTLLRIADNLRVSFVTVAQPTVRILKLLRGELDICQNDLTPELVNYVARQDKLALNRASGGNFSYLGFNLADPILSDIRVRQAIAYAIDRKAIIDSVFYGGARLASSLLPPEHWLIERHFPGPKYNPARAAQLLAELGYSRGNPLTLSYKTSKDPFRVRLASIFQSQLAQVGINLRINSHDWGTFFDDIKAGRFQLYSLAWVGIKTPDIYRSVFHSQSVPPQGANRGKFNNARVDSLLDHAQRSDSWAEQTKSYQEVQAIVLEQLPYVPLWYEGHVLISRTGIAGYTIHFDGNYDGLKQVRKVK